LENFGSSRFLNVKIQKKKAKCFLKIAKLSKAQNCRINSLKKEKKTTGMNVSKEEMNSTSKMLEVLGKRLYQV
jgi:hypothetical protein